MLAKLSKVARTYRTNALWHSGEDLWKRRSRRSTPFFNPPSISSHAFHHDFEPFAFAAALSLSHVLTAAVEAKESVEALTRQYDREWEATNEQDPAFPEQEQKTTFRQQQVEELVQSYILLHQALTSASTYIDSKTLEEALSQPASELWEELGLRQSDGEAASLMDMPVSHQVDASRTGELAVILSETADRLLAFPPEQLLDKEQPQFKTITKYRFRQWEAGQVHTYFSIPLNGILINQYL
ncbi:hypothetical protein [Paenibacillus sp. OAS669]|uniref:hypothetical protein n=1 Tax=Paenibacillus sp. OAS669 TaxID=2663821 RepID=UPI00178A4AFE|nr:hypothetical protein [Paenibacillus sp. OAS669]MBE1442237.1 hypothetical protein [Paenibacillus sp. OAS669]